MTSHDKSATAELQAVDKVRARLPMAASWSLVAGGALWFVGGGLHPKEDPPDVTLTEHLRIMYENDSWYPSHALLFLGVALIAVALVFVVRSRALPDSLQRAAVVAAVGTGAATVAALFHLVMAVDADRIAAGQATPITDVQIVLEALTAPSAGVAIALLAVLGAATRTVGNWAAAAAGSVGGLAYALAGGTLWFTDALNPLFPLAGLIGIWAIVCGLSALRRTNTTAPQQRNTDSSVELITTER